MGVCGFPKRLKLHLQRSALGTERLGPRDFLKARVAPGLWMSGLSLGLVRVESGGATSTPERPSTQTGVILNGPW